MGFFSDPTEAERKANLKLFEDKRVALAERFAREGFAPERMLFAQTERGGFVAVARHAGKCWLVVSPTFGTDEEYAVESFDRFVVRQSEVKVKAEGMGGIFGLGKKGQEGVEYFITRPDGTEISMQFVAGRNGWGEYVPAKNPLLKTKRRRGNANIVWDMKPVELADVSRIVGIADGYFGL